MAQQVPVVWQPSLVDLGEPPQIDPALPGVRRVQLDASSWLDRYVPDADIEGERLEARLARSAEPEPAAG